MTDTTAQGAGPAERAQHAGGDDLGVTAAELSAWRDAFLAAGEASLKTWPADGRDFEIGLLKAQGGGSDHGQRVAGGEDRAAGGRPPFGTAEVEAMSMVVSPSANRSYGVQRVTRVWGTSRATLYRHRRGDEPGTGRRPGPLGPMPDAALIEAIRALLAASLFHGEGYRKLWARLRFAGIRTSRRRVLRLMREHGLLAPGRVGRPHGPKAHDGTIRTERVDLMWGTDLTATLTGEVQAAIFVTVDHASTECLGIHAARRATRFEALEALRQAVRTCFSAFGEGVADGLKLRHDHGSQFVADDFQRELAFLGIASSPAFVREPEGNGCVERFIRTLKENLLWVRRFATIEDLRLALHAFKDSYNRTWIVERHGYQTPAAVAPDHGADQI